MAGTERIELPLTEPESVVLPLDEVPVLGSIILQREKLLYGNSNKSASNILNFLVPFWLSARIRQILRNSSLLYRVFSARRYKNEESCILGLVPRPNLIALSLRFCPINELPTKAVIGTKSFSPNRVTICCWPCYSVLERITSVLQARIRRRQSWHTSHSSQPSSSQVWLLRSSPLTPSLLSRTLLITIWFLMRATSLAHNPPLDNRI